MKKFILVLLALIAAAAPVFAEQAVYTSQFNALERFTGGHAVITTDHAFIHDGIAYTQAGTMTVSTGNTGALFLAVPAASAASLTTDMTNATADITCTAVDTGPAGNSINITYADPGENNATLDVDVFVKTITVTLETDGNGDIVSTAAEVKAAIAADSSAAALVACEDEGDGSGVVEAVANAFLSGGANATYCHFKSASIASNAAVTVSVLEGYIKAGGDSVSALTPINRNRNSSNTSTITVTSGANVTPTQEASYATLATTAIGANLPANRAGGSTASAEEWVFAPGTNYAVSIANASGGDALVSYDLFWYEESGF